MDEISRRGMLAATALGTVALGVPAVASGALETVQRPRVDHYTTEPNAECIDSIAVSGGGAFKFYTLYRLKLPDLRVGDVAVVHSQFEVTSKLRFNVMLGHAMVVHAQETLVQGGQKPGGKIICEYATENITPDVHHGFRTLVGSFAVVEEGDAWVSVVIYAAASKAKEGDTARVEQRYGGLRAIVHRNA